MIGDREVALGDDIHPDEHRVGKQPSLCDHDPREDHPIGKADIDQVLINNGLSIGMVDLRHPNRLEIELLRRLFRDYTTRRAGIPNARQLDRRKCMNGSKIR